MIALMDMPIASAALPRRLQRGAAFAGQHDEQVREVDPADQQADHRVNQVLDQTADDCGEGGADDHADGQVHHAASTTPPRMMKALNSRSQAGSRIAIGACMASLPISRGRACRAVPSAGLLDPAP
jgi:hypothetical protein